MGRELICKTCKTKFNMNQEWARQIQKEEFCPVCGVEEILTDIGEE